MSPIDWDTINMSMPTNFDRAFMGPKKVIDRETDRQKHTDMETYQQNTHFWNFLKESNQH